MLLTCVHIIRVRCSSILSKVLNFSLLTAITAPLKNLSPLMKNRTFLALRPLDTWINDARCEAGAPPLGDTAWSRRITGDGASHMLTFFTCALVARNCVLSAEEMGVPRALGSLVLGSLLRSLRARELVEELRTESVMVVITSESVSALLRDLAEWWLGLRSPRES